VRPAPVPIRVSVIGLGTVGQWLLRAIDRHHDLLRDHHGVDLKLVGVGSRRGGFAYREGGIEISAVLGSGDPSATIGEVVRGDRWPTALAGLEATDTDIVVEVSQSAASDGEPGQSHMRHALGRGISVATSNKWPVALAGVELAAVAERHGAGFRAESTVMSGTPVLAALTTGLGGAEPVRLRGILNATVNFICSRIAVGGSYAEALAEAQQAGLAERDPSDDVNGLDSVAKLMVLSALVFGVQLEVGDVARRGLSSLDEAEIGAALARGEVIRELAELGPRAGHAAVQARPVSPDDALFAVDGTTNAIRLWVDPLGEIAISGPGAGRAFAGQGVFSDLIALARELGKRS
jgi:homoserine dehydrogenase